MRHRLFCIFLLFMLIVGSTQVQPVAATPAAKDDNTAFADYLPADTLFYANIRTTDFQKNVNTVLDWVGKLTGSPLPVSPYAQIDQSLTQLLGRPASFEKDVLPWLGDHIAVGFMMAEADLSNPAILSSPSQKLAVFVSVKDQAAGDAFLKDTLAKVQVTDATMKSSQVKVGSDTATLFTGASFSVLQAKGYYVLGLPAGITAVIDTLNGKGGSATLSADPNFVSTMKLLQPDNLVNVYLSARLYTLAMLGMQAFMMNSPSGDNSAQQFAVIQGFLSAINGQAFGLRIDAKTLRFDVEQTYNNGKLKSAFQGIDSSIGDIKLPALSEKWTDQIPGNTLFVFAASEGLAQLYQDFKTTLPQILSMTASTKTQADQILSGINQAEGQIKLLYNLDPQKDVFSWMNGQFAFYVTYNPNSILVTQASSPSSAAPLDLTLLIKSTDVQKTTDFITKFNTGLKSMKDVTLKDAGNSFYTVSDKTGTGVSYGLSDDTFVVTTSSGLDAATAALQGKDTLSANANWTNAQKGKVEQAAGVVWMNFDAILSAVKASAPAGQEDSPQTRQTLTALGGLESFAVYVELGDNSGSSSIQLTFK